MLTHPTADKLHQLKLGAMAQALTEQAQLPEINSLSFEERLGLLIDYEITERHNRSTTTRLRRARLRQTARAEDIDYQAQRGLDKAVLTRLLTCQWVIGHQNILLTGPTGVGKTYLACALANQACRHGATALYMRLPRLLQELALCRVDGRYMKFLASIAKIDVLVLDDWGLAAYSDESRRDLLELFDDRHARKSTLITSQLPIEHWHENLGQATLADAILDRLLHNAHRITLKGESLRKTKPQIDETTPLGVN